MAVSWLFGVFHSEYFSFCWVFDSRCFIKRQAKVFQISPFVYLYKFHFVQIFETNGHHLSLKSSIGISRVRSTLKRKSRFSSNVRFDVDVIIKETEAENAGVTAKGEEVADMTVTEQ